MLPVDKDDRGSGSEGQDCFPLPKGLVQQPVPQTDDGWLAGQSGLPPVKVVKVSAVLVDATLDLVDIPVPGSETGADGDDGNRPPFVLQAAYANPPVRLEREPCWGCCRWGGVLGAEVAFSTVAEVASSAVAEVASLAYAEVSSSAAAEVVSSAVVEVASLTDAGAASRVVQCVTMMTTLMMSVMMRTLTILTMMIRRILIMTPMCMVLFNLMIMSCIRIFMDRMFVECVVLIEVRLVGHPTGLAMQNVTFV